MRLLLPVLLAFGCATRPAAAPSSSQLTLPLGGPPTRTHTVHALQRLGFGPSPGDLSEVERLGLAAWIDGQLKPGIDPAM
jgi:hypothetical protein